MRLPLGSPIVAKETAPLVPADVTGLIANGGNVEPSGNFSSASTSRRSVPACQEKIPIGPGPSSIAATKATRPTGPALGHSPNPANLPPSGAGSPAAAISVRPEGV